MTIGVISALHRPVSTVADGGNQFAAFELSRLTRRSTRVAPEAPWST